MDEDNSPPDRRFSKIDFFCPRRVWRIDFLRAQRRRSDPATEVLEHDEKGKRRIQALTSQVGQLVRDYCGIAKRVGADIDQTLLLTIYESLKREPLGIQHPRLLPADAKAKERFLAESLYEDLLELAEVTPDASGNGESARLTPEEWRACLGVVADSIATDSPTSYGE